MLNGYRIIDADAHVYEPADMWERYLEPALKHFAPSPPPELKIQGEAIFRKLSNQVITESIHQVKQTHPTFAVRQFSEEAHISAMMQMGIDISFLYPSYGLWVLAIDSMPAQLAGAFVRAYNNWLRDFCSYNPQLLRGVGLINLHAPAEMVPELHRITEFGLQAVVLRPNPVKGRLLNDPTYEDFWTECETLNIAVGIHEGSHSRLPTVGINRFNTRFALHACSHPMEQMMAMLALIEGGVLERHPNLKVGFLESGCGWLPYWLWRLDQEYENLYWEVKENVKVRPSEYFHRQCFISVDSSEPYLAEIIQNLGSDNLILGSDYPHMDHNPDIIKSLVALQEPLSKTTVQKILWDNPARFYGIA